MFIKIFIFIVIIINVSYASTIQSSGAIYKQTQELISVKDELNEFYEIKELEYQKNKAQLEKIQNDIQKSEESIKNLRDENQKILDEINRVITSKAMLMYDKMKGTKFEKFVANPQKGSMHNYGIAVDITIIDMNEKEIDMGFSPFYKGDLLIYWSYAKKKIFNLSDKQKQNRKLLAEVMKKAGFIPLNFEWWHFNGVSKKEARRQYSIIE